MTRTRQGRLSRRQVDDLLAGDAPVNDPLARLLHDASRVPAGQVHLASGAEQDTVAAYRWGQAHHPQITRPEPTLVLLRDQAFDESPVRVPVIRRRVVSVLAAAIAVITVGGVAAAAVGGFDRTPHVVIAADAATHSPSTAPTAPAALTKHPSSDAAPATARASARTATGDRLTTGQRVRMDRICRSWVAQSRPATARDAAVAELFRVAGGPGAASGFCAAVANDLCADWSAKGNQPTSACPYAMPAPRSTRRPTTSVTAAPSPATSVPHTQPTTDPQPIDPVATDKPGKGNGNGNGNGHNPHGTAPTPPVPMADGGPVPQ